MEDVFARQHTGEMRRTLTLVFYLAMIVVLAIVVWTHRYKCLDPYCWNHKNRITGVVCKSEDGCWLRSGFR
jgi:predicted metal-dependent hydrolase